MGRFRMPSASYEEIGGSAGQAATPGPSSSKARPPFSKTAREIYVDSGSDEEGVVATSRADKGKERAENASVRAAKKSKEKSKVALHPKYTDDEIRDQVKRRAKRDKLKKAVKINSQKYVFVGNLNSEVTDAMLEEIFSSFGTVRSITIRSAGGYPSTSQSGGSSSGRHKYESRIYASVEFKNSVSVYRAMQLNGTDLCGQKMAIVRDALDLPEFKIMIDNCLAPSASSTPAPECQPSELRQGSRVKTEANDAVPVAQPRTSTSVDRTGPSPLHSEHTNARIAYQFRPRVSGGQQDSNTTSPTKSTRRR